MQRRLAAVMSADVVGYSALIAANEEGTLVRLKAHMEALVEPTVAAHGGRIVKLMGDGALVEFASVVEAVRAAVEIQRAMALRNAEAPAEQRINFRIGINVGDVVIDGEDIYGDGVNVAARLQERATAGGICISDRVYGDVRGRIDVGIDDLGDQELKNIPEPIRVYRVMTEPDADADVVVRGRKLLHPRIAMLITIVLAALAVAGTFAGYSVWSSIPAGQGPSGAIRPSIAVLPFDNLNNAPAEEYFSDGITNDLINDLSKFADLLVIASNSVFAYKGKHVQVQEVGQDLGVRYVVEGSVQKQGNRVRINVQLVNAGNGKHLWAQRYTEDATDLFEVQERITQQIVRALAVKLTDIEQERAFSKPTQELEAYDYVLRGRHLASILRRKENFEARRLFRKALEIDPDYSTAYVGLGGTHLYSVHYGWTGSPQVDLKRAYDFAQKAIAIDNDNADAHRLMGDIYLTRREYDLALVETERAIAINPHDARSHASQGVILLYAGRPDGAILALETALRFDPLMDSQSLTNLGLAYYLKARYVDAVRVLERCLAQNPEYLFGHVVLAATYGRMGELEKAKRAAQAVRRLNPFFSIDEFGNLFRNAADKAEVAEGLRKAGLK